MNLKATMPAAKSTWQKPWTPFSTHCTRKCLPYSIHNTRSMISKCLNIYNSMNTTQRYCNRVAGEARERGRHAVCCGFRLNSALSLENVNIGPHPCYRMPAEMCMLFVEPLNKTKTKFMALHKLFRITPLHCINIYNFFFFSFS